MTIDFWLTFIPILLALQISYWLGVFVERRSWKKRIKPIKQVLAQQDAQLYSSIGAPTSTVKPCTCPRQWGNGGRIGTASACPTHGRITNKNKEETQ